MQKSGDKSRRRSRHGPIDHLVSVARPRGAAGFRTGVSLHSHTNQSTETLDFLANFGNQFPVMRPLLSRLERRAEADARDSHQLRGQLLDAAHDSQAGL